MSRPRTKRHLLVENAMALDVKAFVSQLGHAQEASVRITFQRPHRLPVEQTIALTSLPRVPFGGRRWYIICPGTGARACRLYLPLHGHLFLSREAHGLRYRAEHAAQEDNDIDKFIKLYRRLTVNPPPLGSLSPIPPRPKGMHEKTYESLRWHLVQVQHRIFAGIDSWLASR